MFSVACSAGFASCKTFGKQPKHPCFGRSPRTGRQPFVPLHLCIDSHLCRCIVQRLCAAVIMRVVSRWCRCIVQRLCATDCKRPCLVRAAAPHSAPARMPGVYAQRLCTMQSQPSIHSPSPRGRGLGFRQGCRDRTPKGFAGRKAHKAFL